MKKSRPKPKQKKWARTLYLLFWLLIVVMFSGLLVMQASRYSIARKELDRVQAELAHEERIYDDLQDQIVYYESDAYIEQLARDQLGYVRPDEIMFVNVAN